ncbi:MAG: DUF192 domain-containing protein [Sphingomonas sp.]|uniref:DUF192 domain-containing protein n=1 Tax=Sphingomonas sp. TaxID=28214 RepID=UPI001B25DCD7|nr:DUF192 domain-containing protein [Sphingomonas sp.]MBO9624578.1 DUF192 domain-containing protein [Sphingomonas sp.]
MIVLRGVRAAVAAAALLVSGACAGGATAQESASKAAAQVAAPRALVTIQTRSGARQFNVEIARTVEEQERGLMYRTNLPPDGGMLFTPYPAEGGGPREASFWMKNTPSPLDILFIRPDGTIATIAANAVPFSEKTLRSGEPVSAVLEINGGKAAELGIAPGDKVTWQLR